MSLTHQKPAGSYGQNFLEVSVRYARVFVFCLFYFNIISFIKEFECICVMVTAVWLACGTGPVSLGKTDWSTQLSEHVSLACSACLFSAISGVFAAHLTGEQEVGTCSYCLWEVGARLLSGLCVSLGGQAGQLTPPPHFCSRPATH